MIAWFINNIGTICVSLVLAAVVGAIIKRMIKDRRKGKSACGCGCSHCAMAGRCCGESSSRKA